MKMKYVALVLFFAGLLIGMPDTMVARTGVFCGQDSVLTYHTLHEVAESQTPAIQIAYLKDGRIEHYNYGYKDISTAEPIDTHTIFQAASLSKVVATYAFLILADKGVLDLDKPLWEYYEYNRLDNERYKKLMTARHVLTHQTGLPNWASPKGSELKARFKPGTDYRYSGEGFVYLQLVAEKLTGKTLDEICSEYVFKPFGMEKSRFTFVDEFADNIAIGHKDMESAKKIHKFMKAGSAHTLYTTADEYMKFVIHGVLNGVGLSAEMHQAFLTPRLKIAPKGQEKEKDRYIKCCLGIRSQDNEAGRAYWHTGSNGAGFQCVFLVYPDTKQAVTIFTNSNTGRNVNLPLFQALFGTNQTYWLTKR